jgi:hypothetical protein
MSSAICNRLQSYFKFKGGTNLMRYDDICGRRNCLQWGLRMLSPQNYIVLLKRHAIELSPEAYKQIEKAHNVEDDIWWWQWLPCEIKKEGISINIGTGKRIANWHFNKLAIFPSWAEYEGFREKLRMTVAKHFKKINLIKL